MAQTESQWRATPAFNYEFVSIVDCVRAAVKHFLSRPSMVFVILHNSTRGMWLIMPWKQFRQIPVDHPGVNASIVFKGTYRQLRAIALSFPPDLFAEIPPNEDVPFASKIASAPDGAAMSKPNHDNGDDPTASPPESDTSDPAAPPSDDDSATSDMEPQS